MLQEIPTDFMRGTKPDVELAADCWLAGGSVRRWFTGEKQCSDFDLFCRNDAAEAALIEANNLTGKMILHKGERTTTYRRGKRIVQIIHLRFDSMEALLESFDFHHCQFGYDGSEVFTTFAGAVSCLRKHLAVNKVQPGFQLDTLRRAFKYAKQGYEPCIGTLRSLAASFEKVTPEELEDQVWVSPAGGRRSSVRWD